jgi:hypothetical protein
MIIGYAICFWPLLLMLGVMPVLLPIKLKTNLVRTRFDGTVSKMARLRFILISV